MLHDPESGAPGGHPSGRIRVLVVDDSALMRSMLPRLLGRDPGIEVIGTAMDGLFALRKIPDLRPDVITLDLDMPRLDGIATLRRIVAEFGIPVIVVSSLSQKNADITLTALEIGAFDYLTKPRDAISVHIDEICEDLIAKVRAAAATRGRKPLLPLPAPPRRKTETTRQAPAERVLAVGVSTGGPNALTHLLPRIPRDFPAGILIVQHMPAGFTEAFAGRLNSQCAIEVREAKDGDLVLAGRALIAPGNRHLKVKRFSRGTIAVLSDAAPVSGHRPSADVLFRSVAAEFGNSATGLIMTGMGADGADGLGEIKAAGGTTIAQDEASCVVFGMPKVAIEKGHVAHIAPLDKLDGLLSRLFLSQEVAHGTVR